MPVDQLDARIIRLFTEEPRIGVMEASRRLGVGPHIDPAALGYGITAFATLEIRQGRGRDVRAHLTTIPELLEMHTITGNGDMLCRIVARSNQDLQHVIDRIVDFDGIVRTATVIALENPIQLRMVPLAEVAAGSG
jgi:DNA-binding Lrp family transcriptional regulator